MASSALEDATGTPKNSKDLLSPLITKKRTKTVREDNNNVNSESEAASDSHDAYVDPLMTVVSTPDVVTMKLTNSLFLTSPNSSKSLVSPTSIEGCDSISPSSRQLIIDTIERQGRRRHSPLAANFSPSMLLTKYERRKRRSSLQERSKDLSSTLNAPTLCGSLVLTGQTKTSTKQQLSGLLDDTHIPLRKRIRLEESQQSKVQTLTSTKSTTTTSFAPTLYPAVSHHPNPQPSKHFNTKATNHHHRPLPRPPPLHRPNGPIVDFLRNQRKWKTTHSTTIEAGSSSVNKQDTTRKNKSICLNNNKNKNTKSLGGGFPFPKLH